MLKDFKEAKRLASEIGWRGDFVEGPVVLWIPGEESFDHASAWKQESGGHAYVVSPRPLDWLDGMRF